MKFAICALVCTAWISAFGAGETNQLVSTNQSLTITNQPVPVSEVESRGRKVLETFDNQIADLHTEIQQVRARSFPLQATHDQRQRDGLPPDPKVEQALAQLNGDMQFLTDQLQKWTEERAVFLRTRGVKPRGPRPVPPPGPPPSSLTNVVKNGNPAP